MGRAWIGVDIGKEFHWALAIDEGGKELLSRRVNNEEADLEMLITEARGLGLDLLWAMDMNHGPATLLVALLLAVGQDVVYVPGLLVNRCRTAFVGESKTDRKDARVIAENARMRHDLARFSVRDELVVSLRLLVERRRDLVCDRTRTIERLRAVLLQISPALERTLNPRFHGPLVLLARYQTPAAIRRSGQKRIATFLKSHGVIKSEALAARAVEAAHRQQIALPGEDTAGALVGRMATELLALEDALAIATRELEACFFSHPQAAILMSLPGMGACLGAEFLAAVGDVTRFASAGRLAAYAGLAPVSRDSGKVQGRLVRARTGNRSLKFALYQSAFCSLSVDPVSRAYYDRKRDEGKTHGQALIALARRRTDVLWAMLRDEARYRRVAA